MMGMFGNVDDNDKKALSESVGGVTEVTSQRDHLQNCCFVKS